MPSTQAETRTRRDHSCADFYKGQFLALLEALPASLKVECLTVDACQGAEFDYVLISPVRSNGRKAIGFVADSRRINVAVSRAKRMCIILGDHRTMSSRPGTDWHTIYSSCRKEAYHEGMSMARAGARARIPFYASAEEDGS